VLSDPDGYEFCVIEPNNGFLAGCGRVGELACDGTRGVGVFWSKALCWPASATSPSPPEQTTSPRIPPPTRFQREVGNVTSRSLCGRLGRCIRSSLAGGRRR
jgi:hypothetical protein